MKLLKEIVYENGVMPVLFAEEGCTVVSEETIVSRLNKSIELGRHYRKGLK